MTRLAYSIFMNYSVFMNYEKQNNFDLDKIE